MASDMTHYMNLNKKPFDAVEAGYKTIELRLYDDKRRGIMVGDSICFTCVGDTARTVTKTVKALHVFNNFEELYNSLPLIRCGYTSRDVENADFTDMEEYYTPSQQKKYGVVGIELD